MNLAETQKLFWSLIVREADPSRSQVEVTFLGSKRMPAEERVDVYANMYFWRILDAIREDFPHTASMLGDEMFDRFVRDYLRAYPSEHPSLGYIGRHFPAFLREHKPGLSRTDVAALAELEWVRARVFEAESLPAVTAASLGEVPSGEIPAVVLKLIPALQVVDYARGLIDVHAAKKAGLIFRGIGRGGV